MRDDGVTRKVQLGWLLDFYGGFLTARQRKFIDLHHNQDLSLVEIADQEGISRQGVHDVIRRGEATLTDMEENLGLARRFMAMRGALERLDGELCAWEPESEQDLDRKTRWLCIAGELLAAWQDEMEVGHGI